MALRSDERSSFARGRLAARVRSHAASLPAASGRCPRNTAIPCRRSVAGDTRDPGRAVSAFRITAVQHPCHEAFDRVMVLDRGGHNCDPPTRAPWANRAILRVLLGDIAPIEKHTRPSRSSARPAWNVPGRSAEAHRPRCESRH